MVSRSGGVGLRLVALPERMEVAGGYCGLGLAIEGLAFWFRRDLAFFLDDDAGGWGAGLAFWAREAPVFFLNGAEET